MRPGGISQTSDFRARLANFARKSSILGRLAPKSPRCRPNLTEFGKRTPKSCRKRGPRFGRIAPEVAPKSTMVGSIGTDLGLISTEFVRSRSNSIGIESVQIELNRSDFRRGVWCNGAEYTSTFAHLLWSWTTTSLRNSGIRRFRFFVSKAGLRKTRPRTGHIRLEIGCCQKQKRLAPLALALVPLRAARMPLSPRVPSRARRPEGQRPPGARFRQARSRGPGTPCGRISRPGGRLLPSARRPSRFSHETLAAVRAEAMRCISVGARDREIL